MSENDRLVPESTFGATCAILRAGAETALAGIAKQFDAVQSVVQKPQEGG